MNPPRPRLARLDPRALLFGLFAIAVLLAAGTARAGIYEHDGLAIGGTDPVAYFTEGKPVQGSSEHSYEYEGSTWHFASAENRDAFAAEPEKYAPQYGGYCAYAAANNVIAKTVPEAWKIVDDKLYLNYSMSIQKRWEEDIPGYIAKGDANWPDLQ